MMRSLYRKHEGVIKEALRFVLVGVIAQLLHLAIYWCLVKFINASVSFTLGYVIAFVANFYLSAYFTFRSVPSWKKMFGMAGAHVINYFLELALLNLFIWADVPEVLEYICSPGRFMNIVNSLGGAKEWAMIPTLAISVPVNFLMVRFVFKRFSGKETK